ncbi:hypothetical protein [Paenibacillus dauci]|uniref:hypothetical protein n=1 Tax=Paenibacillus dauci TaxID=1567106 RepID=UPI0006196F5F|nr:hypothetical protein [Paenibacillus dauci]
MNWYTLGQMLSAIRLGQKARTMDGIRIVIRTTDGLLWAEGRLSGQRVSLQDYLFTDLWTIYEDEDTVSWLPQRDSYEQREREMLENQYLEWRAERRTE